MLVLKKTPTKKIAIYISIIAIMVFGSGFLLYRDNKSTQPNPTNNNAQDLEAAAGEVMADDQAAENQAVPENGALVQPAEIDKTDDGGAIDLKIFSSEKYKNLGENALIPKEPAVKGKINPFKPD